MHPNLFYRNCDKEHDRWGPNWGDHMFETQTQLLYKMEESPVVTLWSSNIAIETCSLTADLPFRVGDFPKLCKRLPEDMRVILFDVYICRLCRDGWM